MASTGPSYYVYIGSVPLKPNAKFDRKALPDPEDHNLTLQYAELTNHVEKMARGAFTEGLKLDSVGIHNDFPKWEVICTA